jgi:hypothetical protein
MAILAFCRLLLEHLPQSFHCAGLHALVLRPLHPRSHSDWRHPQCHHPARPPFLHPHAAPSCRLSSTCYTTEALYQHFLKRGASRNQRSTPLSIYPGSITSPGLLQALLHFCHAMLFNAAAHDRKPPQGALWSMHKARHIIARARLLWTCSTNACTAQLCHTLQQFQYLLGT